VNWLKCNCSPLLRHGFHLLSLEGQADGVDGADGFSASCFDNGADVGIETRAPRGAEAVGDFPKSHAGPQRALGSVIGGRDGPVCHEDEHVAADFFDDALQFDAGGMGWRAGHERVEAGLEARGIGLERGVGKFFASSPDPAGAAQQVAQAGGKQTVARFDGVLHVADKMGEADLMLRLGPSHLAAVAVGYPVIGPPFAQKRLRHAFAARGLGHKHGVVLVVEHPQPPVLLADPQAGLVRFQRCSTHESGADAAGLRGESLARRRQHVDQRAFADGKAQKIGHEPRQPFKGNALGEAQIEDEGAQVWPERRPPDHVRGAWRLELSGAARAGSAMQHDAGHSGRDGRYLDMVISLADGLRQTGDIRAAMLAGMRHHIAPGRWIGMQRAMRARMRLALRRAGRLTRWLGALRGWRAGIIRRLRRQAEPGFKFSDTRRQNPGLPRQRGYALSLRQHKRDQRFLVERFKRAAIHPKLESARRKFVKTQRQNQNRRAPEGSEQLRRRTFWWAL
jgi:hypothetical protein